MAFVDFAVECAKNRREKKEAIARLPSQLRFGSSNTAVLNFSRNLPPSGPNPLNKFGYKASVGGMHQKRHFIRVLSPLDNIAYKWVFQFGQRNVYPGTHSNSVIGNIQTFFRRQCDTVAA
jgi:hypothetical protein